MTNDPLTQPLPVIAGVKEFHHKVVIDDSLTRMLVGDEETLDYIRSEFSHSAAKNIVEHIILLKEDQPLRNIPGMLFMCEYGFIPDMNTFRKEMRARFHDYYMEGYTKAVTELAATKKEKDESH